MPETFLYPQLGFSGQGLTYQGSTYFILCFGPDGISPWGWLPELSTLTTSSPSFVHPNSLSTLIHHPPSPIGPSPSARVEKDTVGPPPRAWKSWSTSTHVSQTLTTELLRFFLFLVSSFHPPPRWYACGTLNRKPEVKIFFYLKGKGKFFKSDYRDKTKVRRGRNI